MIHDVVQPDSIDEFQQQLLLASSQNKSLTIVGSRSKVRNFPSAPRHLISTVRYCGIVDHQASDFTVTVRTGTPVKHLVELLDSVGQYLPFDPVFVNKGATVGGLVGAGLNGPCRLRFGGLRDFVIGCQFIDGRGRVIRAGGKVVKNAAGFDLPKFLIGSAGRFGLLLEVTFKVFPKRRFFRSAVFESGSTIAAMKMLQELSSSPMDFEALEIMEDNRVAARWSADSEASLALLQPADLLSANVKPLELIGETERRFWSDLANFEMSVVPEAVIKVPVNRNSIPALDRWLSDLEITRRFCAAGNVAILFLGTANRIDEISSRLMSLGLTGQIVVGRCDQFLVGATPQLPFLRRVKSALDPENRFGSIEIECPTETSR